MENVNTHKHFFTYTIKSVYDTTSSRLNRMVNINQAHFDDLQDIILNVLLLISELSRHCTHIAVQATTYISQQVFLDIGFFAFDFNVAFIIILVIRYLGKYWLQFSVLPHWDTELKTLDMTPHRCSLQLQKVTAYNTRSLPLNCDTKQDMFTMSEGVHQHQIPHHVTI